MWSKSFNSFLSTRGAISGRCIPLSLSKTTLPSSSLFQRKNLSYSSQEPGFQVDWDDSMPDPNDFTPAYLTDHKKMEIYYKHKSDPKEWNVKTISQRYGLSLIRAQAVLYLMKEREALMKELGVLNIPTQWQEIYSEHVTEPEVKTAEFLAEKHSLAPEEVEKILKNMEEHQWRKQNLNDSNDYHDEVLDFLAMAGTDPSPHPTPTLAPFHSPSLPLSVGTNTSFRETGEAPKAGHLETESYFDPILFGDEDFESMKTKIRERLIRETKASQKMELKIQRYESRVKTWNQLFKTVPGLRQDPVTEGEGQQQQQSPEAVAGEGTAEMCRWKYAFRELRSRKSGEPPHPTVMTMRDGRYRDRHHSPSSPPPSLAVSLSTQDPPRQSSGGADEILVQETSWPQCSPRPRTTRPPQRS
jgi:hypothetical protein